MIRLFVPGRPVPKGRPRVWRGRAHTPERTRAWEQEIAWRFKERCPGVAPLERPVLVRVVVFRFAYHTRLVAIGDLDNYVKAVLDALNGLAWSDDELVIKLEAEKRKAKLCESEGILIEIEEV